MHGSKTSIAVLLLLTLVAGAAVAAEAPKGQAAREIALFSVPKLMEGTTLQDLAGALAKEPGIVSAQADTAKDSFKVTFETKKTDPDKILETVKSVANDAKLVAVMPADGKPSGKDCGKCPRSKSCPGAGKK
jgi:copper chaperone CopZ